MNNCPTVKEVIIPGCYSGVLKVNLGLEPGTNITWVVNKEGFNTFSQSGTDEVNPDGSLVLTALEINFYNTYKLRLWEGLASINPSINIKGYDCYRIMPVKNTNVVVDVII